MEFHITNNEVHTRGDIFRRGPSGGDVIVKEDIAGGTRFYLSEGRYYYRYTSTGAGEYAISLQASNGVTFSGPEDKTAPEIIDTFNFRVI